jgi:hypothetical protein
MMKIYAKTLALTAVISALSMPVLAQSVSATQVDSSGATEAAQMVPAVAQLTRTLDADKNHLDSTFQAELSQKITLTNGTVLPSHTLLIGTVTRDDMQAGNSEFALRLNQAKLKDGKTLPIKATIVDIAQPNFNTVEYPASNNWTSQTLTVEEPNVVSGVDLHSEIASNDSVVLVSTRKRDVKVPAGSQLKLAIGPASDASSSTN